MQQNEKIKGKIKERYGKIALTGNNSNNNYDCWLYASRLV
jgi:hypothetical protein